MACTTGSYPVGMSEDEQLRGYLEAVGRLPPLTDSEIHVLAEAEQSGAWSEAARKRLIEGSLRAVVMIAEEYRDQGLSLRELLEAGNVGLVRAVHDFDWRRSSEFQGHTTAAIRDAITDALSGRG
jgi:RNA polymerase nonessential primary-like sigma factor